MSFDKTEKKRYLVIYTAVFCLMSVAVLFWYIVSKRTLIWEVDGWYQHYNALLYWGKYLRSIIKELLINHRLALKEWEFALGEGSDVFQTLSYYVILDPFSFFSIFVPSSLMWLYYDLMIVLRLYLAGLAFSALCAETIKGCTKTGILAGAISYVFCHWALFSLCHHPFFLNPMVYLPLVVLGAERVMKKKSPKLFIFSVFFSAISNFYYFYVIVVLTVLYVAFRLPGHCKKNIKQICRQLLYLAGYSLTGVLMAGVILLPGMYAFMNDGRMEAGNAWHLLYPLSYYENLPSAFLSGGGLYYLYLGYSAPVLAAVLLLFAGKGKSRLLKRLFAAGVLIIAVPAAGQVLNGFSYMSNRWCFGFALLSCYILTAMWEEMMNLKAADGVRLFICMTAWFVLCFMIRSNRTAELFSCMAVALLFLLLIILPDDGSSLKETVCLRKNAGGFLLVATGVLVTNSFVAHDYSLVTKTVEEAKTQLMLSEAADIERVANTEGYTGFYRYSGRFLTENANLPRQLSSSNFYWTISNPYIAQNMRDMELMETLLHHRTGYDDRTALNTLSSVRYFAVPGNDGTCIPYGFTLVEDPATQKDVQSVSGYRIYKNEYMLPFGFTSENVISKEQWESLGAVERQSALLWGIYLEDGAKATEDIRMSGAADCTEISCEISGMSDGVSRTEKSFVVTDANSTVSFSVNAPGAGETYFCISGLEYDSCSTYDLYFGDESFDPEDRYKKEVYEQLPFEGKRAVKRAHRYYVKPDHAELVISSSSGVTKELSYLTKDFAWYNGRHDFSVNLGYEEKAPESITVMFTQPGIYSFDSIKVVSQPFGGYAGRIAALSQTHLRDVVIEDDSVSGNIDCGDDCVLCLQIPYHSGWSAEVDGKKTALCRADVKYLGLKLSAGSHEIKLTYKTPLLRAGAFVSLAGFLLYFFLLYIAPSAKTGSQNRKDTGKGDSEKQ